MARRLIFKFRISREEQLLIIALAKRLARTRSDVIRLLIRQACIELGLKSREDGT